MTQRTVADFLTPAGFAPPRVGAVLREGSVVREAGRLAVGAVSARGAARRAAYVGAALPRASDPVLLVPGFLAGDLSLGLLARSLRAQGHRTYRSRTRANVGCTVAAAARLEERLEAIAHRRDSRVQVVGHSLGGMLARGVAARRPDLVSGVVTLGSPVLAPGAHHATLARSVDVLVRLTRAGLPGLMAEDCVAGECARTSFDQAQAPVHADVRLTSVYSRRDGIVDWRACIDPASEAVEVSSSHVGMAIDPEVAAAVLTALQPRAGSVVEVDRGEIA